MLGGVFVGGSSSRMGSPKGLLVGPDGRRLVERAIAVLEAAGLDAVLVGDRPEYAGLAPVVADAVADAGPLSGLVGLLERAGGERVFVLACDMPFVTAGDVRALLAMDGALVVPRRDERWEPLCAVYGPEVLPIARARLDAGRRSISRLVDALQTVAARLPPDHLRDWDTPDDVSAR